MARKVRRLAGARALTAALRRLYDADIRLPVLRVGEYRFALHPDSGRVYVRIGNAHLGTLLTSGLFREDPDAPEITLKLLPGIVENPLEVIAMVSRVLPDPRCAVCFIPLGTKLDKKRGIGAKCWKKGGFDELEKSSSAVATSSRKIEKRRKVRRK